MGQGESELSLSWSRAFLLQVQWRACLTRHRPRSHRQLPPLTPPASLILPSQLTMLLLTRLLRRRPPASQSQSSSPTTSSSPTASRASSATTGRCAVCQMHQAGATLCLLSDALGDWGKLVLEPCWAGYAPEHNRGPIGLTQFAGGFSQHGLSLECCMVVLSLSRVGGRM